mmetsp:Transcript_31078/g.53130  ORF Transcript_31078/g.53130 Transcript_31078/m.53130 type:complete len:195 (+) Transcript_31078:205-789(+)|eukprot:CAMPEP_0183732600 /NCGR_PEP_ID=MMETSP0737-20130205/38845_1 /TAXON_ID=385413 /ORGANISM="Thalassiosira miniscula, Strain CCMP1093" /LENGTH=194 /DNA_ID=CAMNT_0025965649 /DNA_START=229 /DNA_END=813 /DNA_ORIENTATION=-
MIRSILLALVASAAPLTSAFVAPCGANLASCHRSQQLFMSTVIKPPETETEKRQKKDEVRIPGGEGDIRGPVEWLIDDPQISREEDEPFHILLLDETFVQNDRITIEYVATSCSYVLGMPYDESAELAAHAEKEGFSCLGTWAHDECVRLAGQLQNRDIVCRVVPFCEGGDRAWQARDARDESDMKRAEDTGFN